jgi:hypothetical protein
MGDGSPNLSIKSRIFAFVLKFCGTKKTREQEREEKK